MKTFEKLIRILQTTMEEPKSGGLMHIVAIVSVVVLTLLLCILFRDANETTFRAILVSIWTVMFLMEVIKQVSISCVFAEDGTMSWHYDWGQFTLQLCDSPIYLLLPVAFLKNGKARSYLSVFMATYILLGGIATYCFPASIYTIYAYRNVHSLVHHGLQIASAALIGIRNRKDLTIKNFLAAIGVFVIAVVIATVYNIVMHKLHPEQLINMFFISPYFVKTVPAAFNTAWQNMHWIMRIALYIVGVTALALIIFGIFRLIIRLFWGKNKKQQAAA